MIHVKTLFAQNELRNYSYLLYEDTTKDAWVIDPYDAIAISHFINEESLNLQGVINTHGHYDHIKGNSYLLDKYSKSILNFSELTLSEEFKLKCIKSPGHTLDHQVFILCDKDGPVALFAGDTLFGAGVGNCKNGGNVELLFETITKLKHELKENILIYPGHDYVLNNLKFALTIEPSNLEINKAIETFEKLEVEERVPLKLQDELKYNPFFRLESPEIREKLDLTGSGDKEIFLRIRSIRDNW